MPIYAFILIYAFISIYTENTFSVNSLWISSCRKMKETAYNFIMRTDTGKNKYGLPAGKVRRTENMLLKIAPEADIPDILPCIRLTGKSHIEIENHRGVLEFGSSLIRIYTVLGILKLTGEGLEMRLADRETLVCDGKIRMIEYENL